MKNRDYWRNRSVELKKSLLNKSESYYKDLEKQYDITLKNIEKDIYSWHMRFANNNNNNNNKLSYQDANKLLNSKELKELRWDINEYIKHGVDNKKWLKELENASCKAHITRLECLELQIKQQINNLYSNELKDVEKLMSDIYKENYYHSAYELAKGTGLGMLVKLDVNKINKIISKPWVHDGLNFSERIWGKHRTELIDYLHTELTQSIIRGKNPQKLIDKISKKFNVSKSKAGNLVMTESAFFSAESQKDCFNDLGVEEYEIVATLDLKTSEICQSMDGQVFKMSEYEVGVTANPFHSYCRSCTCPYFDDEFTQDEKRVARGVDGKVHYVDSNIRYEEWYNKFIKEDISLKKSNNTAKQSGIIKLPKKLKLEGVSSLDNPLKFVIPPGLYRFIPKDTVITELTVMAGQGTSTEFRGAKKYAKNYGGHYSEWRKMAGKITSNNYDFDVHWVEHDKYGKLHEKLKPNFKEKNK